VECRTTRRLTLTIDELFAFIRDTIDREFTVELEYLTVFDSARRRLAEIVDMPDQRLDFFSRLRPHFSPHHSSVIARC